MESRCTPTERAHRASGKILVELVLSIPLLIGVPLAVMEQARFLKMTQIANVMSQEASLLAYRECSDIYAYKENATTGEVDFDLTTAKQRTATCLQRRSDDMRARLSQILPGVTAHIVMSVYRRNMGVTSESETKPLELVAQYSTAGLSAVPSKYKLADSTIKRETSSGYEPALQTNSISARERIVIGELVYTYVPILNLIPLLNISTAALGVPYREATIL